jgi:hypothetical protein
MAERIGTTLVVAHTDPADCELCGQSAELRPYGPGGKNVCIECAYKDPENMRRFHEDWELIVRGEAVKLLEEKFSSSTSDIFTLLDDLKQKLEEIVDKKDE